MIKYTSDNLNYFLLFHKEKLDFTESNSEIIMQKYQRIHPPTIFSNIEYIVYPDDRTRICLHDLLLLKRDDISAVFLFTKTKLCIYTLTNRHKYMLLSDTDQEYFWNRNRYNLLHSKKLTNVNEMDHSYDYDLHFIL